VLKQAIAGVEIGIRSNNTIVALHPLPLADRKAEAETLSPREALRQLQQEAHLSETQAAEYLNEVHSERLASENRGKP